MCCLWLNVLSKVSPKYYTFVPLMKRCDLRLVMIGTHTVFAVVFCEFSSIVFEDWVRGCDAQVVYVDEDPCSIMDWLIIGVYVETNWRESTPRWQAILL